MDATLYIVAAMAIFAAGVWAGPKLKDAWAKARAGEKIGSE